MEELEEVTITKRRLAVLEHSHKLLRALEAGGVDNWEWYSEAYREAFPNEDDDL